MSNTVKGYFEPSSTKVHSNIDDLILQSKLDEFAQTGVMYADKRPKYIGGADDVVANIALSPILTLKSMRMICRSVMQSKLL